MPSAGAAADRTSDEAVPGAPFANPLAGTPLRTRADVQEAVRACYQPLLRHLSPVGARAVLGPSGATFDPATAQLEGFARPLWGLAALGAGGGTFDHWGRVRQGLAAGVDPEHPEYWGPVVDHDQRTVEAAAIGAGLALAPDQLWAPLDDAARQHLVDWLSALDRIAIRPNNWLFFRVLAGLGLARVGIEPDRRAQREALDGLDRLYQGDGWYRDGATGLYDWYNAFAFHTYGLFYAGSGLGDPGRAQVFRERAAAFAVEHQHWFGPDGAALALGRSMTYRFAQAAFWGALAVADVEALPWATTKGLYLRNLRWWSRQAVTGPDGLLTVGYGYDGRRLAEGYNSPGSPYWAMKGFLAVAAPADHPFWQVEEAPLDLPEEPVTQLRPGLVLSRDAEQVLALAGGQVAPAWLEGAAPKYQRLAYSSRLAFGADTTVGESTLWLRTRHGQWLHRGDPSQVEVSGSVVASRWEPRPGVVVDTALWGRAPWHGRVHRVRTERTLELQEFGFALGLQPGPAGQDTHRIVPGAHDIVVVSPVGASGLVDLGGDRRADARTGWPNAHLLWPRTLVPSLTGRVRPGTTDVVTVVLGAGPAGSAAWDERRAAAVVPAEVWDLLYRRAPRRSAAAMCAAGAVRRLRRRLRRPLPGWRQVRDRLR